MGFKIKYEFKDQKYVINHEDLSIESSVSDLLSQIYAKTFGGESKKLVVMFNGAELEDNTKTLRECGFREGKNRIIVALGNKGGTQMSSEFPSDIKTKKTRCVFYYMDYICAELECGCWMSNKGILKFISSCNDSNDLLNCPSCKKVLNDIDKIFYLANYDDDDLEDRLYDETTKRYRKFNKDENSGTLSKCPNCKTFNKRPKSNNQYRIKCGECERDYCYECEDKWKTSGFVLCGNKDCETWEIQEDLLNCPPLPYKNRYDWVKTYNDKYGTKDEKEKIPSLRACPGCWRLLCVIDACPHITCMACKHEFCYICLNKWSGHNSTNCMNNGPYSRQILN